MATLNDRESSTTLETKNGEHNTLDHKLKEVDFQSQINEFLHLIDELTLRNYVEYSQEERRQMIADNLNFDQFCVSIRGLFNTEISVQDLKSLYRKLTTNPDAKFDWTEIFGYSHNESTDESINTPQMAPLEESEIFMINKKWTFGEAAGDHHRRDTVQHICNVPHLDLTLAISLKGAVTVWGSNLHLHSTTELNESSWSTAVGYMHGNRRVVAATERSLHFFDYRTSGKNQQVFAVKPFAQSPRCLAWIPSARNSQEDTLVFGDDQGYLNFVTITNHDLVAKQINVKNRPVQSFTIDPQKLDVPIKRYNVSDDWIVSVKYLPELKCLAWCSPSEQFSFYLEPLEKISNNTSLRPVAVSKGVNAFAFCATANVIITGGIDKTLRVWHPHIFGRPTGKLTGHLFTICDITINEKDQHIISLSTARVFRVWDIQTLSCLQTFTDQEELAGERRVYSIVYDAKHDRLFSGSCVLDCWPLTRSFKETMQVPQTHNKPISAILYNPNLNQLVTACTEGFIKVWEIDSGKCVYSIPKAHGEDVEITSLALDGSGYRLASGANDSSIMVWDFGSGQEIKFLKGVDSEDSHPILGMQYITHNNQRCIIASGWTNKVMLILDGNRGREMEIICEFSDLFNFNEINIEEDSNNDVISQNSVLNPYETLPNIGENDADLGSTKPQQERILLHHFVTCQTVYNSDMLISGCMAGNLLMWDIDARIIDKLVLLNEDKSKINNEALEKRSLYQVTCIRILIHRVLKRDPNYIKKSESQLSIQIDSKQSTANKADEVFDDKSDDKKPPSKQSQGTDFLDQQTIENAETSSNKEKSVSTGQPMIEDVYDPVIVTIHQDSFIRFWNFEGKLLHQMTPQGKASESILTSCCCDTDANKLLIGDSRGYLYLFQISAFLQSLRPPPPSPALLLPQKSSFVNRSRTDSSLLETNRMLISHATPQQLVSWRGHLSKIVSLEFVPKLQIWATGSHDTSVRFWWGDRGRYLGYCGQGRFLRVPQGEEVDGQATLLPVDIRERPVIPQRSSSAHRKEQVMRNMDCPLQVDMSRWDPFSRTQFIQRRREPTLIKGPMVKPLEKKFFKTVIKRRHQKELIFESDYDRSDAVYAALPFYRVQTPPKVIPPSNLTLTILPKIDGRSKKKVKPRAVAESDIFMPFLSEETDLEKGTLSGRSVHGRHSSRSSANANES